MSVVDSDQAQEHSGNSRILPTAISIDRAAEADDDAIRRKRLRQHPRAFATLGVLHTLLTAGVVFGWASLLPVLRREGLELTPAQFARIFTHGAVGNYLSSLPLGLFLDRRGPRACGMVASTLFALGLILCSWAHHSTICLDVGFALLGFAGPAVQLATLHLAQLFSDDPAAASEASTSSGAAALFMSAQAAAFDGGTMVFCIFSYLANSSLGFLSLSSAAFFRLYSIVPAMTFITAVFYWPIKSATPSTDGLDEHSKQPGKNSFVGASPYLSPAFLTPSRRRTTAPKRNPLKDAPLHRILSHPPFYCLAWWVSIHILKLNFIVATVNDQLVYANPGNPSLVTTLVNIFGAMLPFGFVVLPLVAHLLSQSASWAFQLANLVGVLYGSVLTFFPSVASYQILLVFTAVATSRQLVYSTVFHETAELFGFRHYGLLLGLTNIMVSSISMIQSPLVEWAENVQSYYGPNLLLLLLTLPLFVVVYGVVDASPPSEVAQKKKNKTGTTTQAVASATVAEPTESTALLTQGRQGRSNSAIFVV